MEKNIFQLDNEQLKEIARSFKAKVEEGLNTENAEIQCIPTFITPKAIAGITEKYTHHKKTRHFTAFFIVLSLKSVFPIFTSISRLKSPFANAFIYQQLRQAAILQRKNKYRQNSNLNKPIPLSKSLNLLSILSNDLIIR